MFKICPFELTLSIEIVAHIHKLFLFSIVLISSFHRCLALTGGRFPQIYKPIESKFSFSPLCVSSEVYSDVGEERTNG